MSNSLLRNIVFLFTFLALVVGLNKTGLGQIVSFQSGAWNSNTTWVGGVIPSVTNSVIINHTVTIDETAEINNLYIGTSGKLEINSTLVLNGNLTMPNNDPELIANAGASVFIFGSAILANKVTVDLSSYFIVLGNFTISGGGATDIEIDEASIYVFGDFDAGSTGLNSCDDYDNLTIDNTETCHIGTETAFEENINEGIIPPEIEEIVNPCTPPSITNPGDQTSCDNYTLPIITGSNLSGNEKYYDNSQLSSGQAITGPITSTQTVWIYDESGSGCSDEESFEVTINPLPTGPTANNNTTTYNGLVHAASAIVGAGETIDWYTASTGGTGTTAPSGINVGTYTAWAEARNLTTGCISNTRKQVTLTINKRPVTVNTDNKQKNCGDSEPALTYQITSGSVISGDNFTGSLTREVGETLGDYDILQGTFALNSNYDLTFVPGIFTISDTESPVANCVSTLTVNLDANGEAAITPEMINNESTDNCGIDTMWVSPEVLACSGSVGGSAEKNYSATIATSDGADVTITLSNFEVVPHSTICTNGYNYDIKFDYEIDYSGSNSFTLWTKQLNITINGDAFDIQTGVTGTVSSVTTTNNQYRSESDCNTVSFSDLVVNSITWYVAANYIPEQTITLQEESSSPSSQNVTLTVVDNSGNTNTCTTAVILNDAIAPAPDVAILPNITAECSVTSLTAPTATDNCVGSITGTHNATLPITTQGTTVVIWTYDDGNGNISTQTQNVVIDDVSDPTFTCPTATTVAFDASCQVTIPDLISGITDENDNCGTPTLSQLPVAGTVLASGAGMTHTVTITADDGNGNTKTCDVSVTGEPTDPIDISIVALADFCQSGQNGTTTITWTVTLLAGTPDWSYDYTIKDGSSELASDTNVSATGDITISYTMNNQANDKTFTLTITNVKDDCGISETGTTVHIEDVTVQVVPATGEIIPD